MTDAGRSGPEPGQSVDFRFRDIAFSAYGPSIVSSTGHGAVMPVLALRASELGAGVGTAALVVALVGVGQLTFSLPAGALVARIGERGALLLAGLVDALAMAAAFLTDSVAALGAAVLVSGMAWTVFLIARQGYVIDIVPFAYRARAMSALGGSHRIGLFVGPLIGAGLIHAFSLRAVFVLAAVLALGAAAIALGMTDLGTERRIADRARGHVSVWSVVSGHRRLLATLGLAVVLIGASRSLRTSLLPLWSEHVGIAASTTSLIFAAAALIDIAFFLPGGWLMDTRGRAPVAVPVVLAAAVGCLVLPWATTVATVTAVMVLIALGNGLGSGIVMTLGADAAPEVGRAQFLGAWRLCGDIGNSGGPLLVGLLAGLAPLAVASVLLGALLLAGTGWVGYWVRRVDRDRLGLSPRSP